MIEQKKEHTHARTVNWEQWMGKTHFNSNGRWNKNFLENEPTNWCGMKSAKKIKLKILTAERKKVMKKLCEKLINSSLSFWTIASLIYIALLWELYIVSTSRKPRASNRKSKNRETKTIVKWKWMETIQDVYASNISRGQNALNEIEAKKSSTGNGEKKNDRLSGNGYKIELQIYR